MDQIKNNNDFDSLKKAVEELLYYTEAGGNGAYFAEFGPVLFSRLAKITGYDVSKRRIKKSIKKD